MFINGVNSSVNKNVTILKNHNKLKRKNFLFIRQAVNLYEISIWEIKIGENAINNKKNRTFACRSKIIEKSTKANPHK